MQRTEWAVARTKIKRETYAALNQYCKKENTTISEYLRDLIEANVHGVIPINQAGKNIVEYNKKEDSFSWAVKYDNGPETQLASHLQPEFLENVLNVFGSGLELRKTYLKKTDGQSVPIPTKMKRLQGEKKHA